MLETRKLIHQNFHIFHDFFDVFNNSFHLFVVPSEQVDLNKAQQANMNYRMFIYERPLPHFRGLPPYDDNGISKPIVESDLSDASSEEEEVRKS